MQRLWPKSKDEKKRPLHSRDPKRQHFLIPRLWSKAPSHSEQINVLCWLMLHSHSLHRWESLSLEQKKQTKKPNESLFIHVTETQNSQTSTSVTKHSEGGSLGISQTLNKQLTGLSTIISNATSSQTNFCWCEKIKHTPFWSTNNTLQTSWTHHFVQNSRH